MLIRRRFCARRERTPLLCTKEGHFKQILCERGGTPLLFQADSVREGSARPCYAPKRAISSRFCARGERTPLLCTKVGHFKQILCERGAHAPVMHQRGPFQADKIEFLGSCPRTPLAMWGCAHCRPVNLCVLLDRLNMIIGLF